MIARLSCLIVVAGLVGACHSAQPESPAPTPAILSHRMPTEAAGFRRTAHETLPDGGGDVFRFRDASSGYLSVIVYTDSAARRIHRAPEALVGYEGAKFAQVMDIQVRRGLYREYRLLASRLDSVPITSGVPRGHTSTATGVLRGRPVVEYQRLFLLDTMFMKVRATVPQTTWPRPDIDDAVRIILTAVSDRGQR